MLIVISYIIILWFLSFVNKGKNMKRMNEKWNYMLYQYYYYMYGSFTLGWNLSNSA